MLSVYEVEVGTLILQRLGRGKRIRELYDISLNGLLMVSCHGFKALLKGLKLCGNWRNLSFLKRVF